MAKQSRALRILLIEDNPADSIIVQEHLSASNLKFELETSDQLVPGLDKLTRARFDVVLLDLALPDSRGIETFYRVRAASVECPVVILSGREDEEFAATAVREGAQDYLLKGSFGPDGLIRAIRYAIERTRRLRMEKELRSAAEIQQRLLPKTSSQVLGFDIAGKCIPAAYVGGDYFDFFPMGDEKLGVVIADAAGHGIAPAITMTETRAVIRTLATSTSDVGEILTKANYIVAKDLTEQTFVALFLACLDSSSQSLQFAAAGHHGSILNEHGRERARLESKDPPLGIQGHKYSSSGKFQLAAGESLFLYTDGLVDCENSEGSRYGRYRLMEAIVGCHETSAVRVLSNLFKELSEWVGTTPRVDDLSAVLVKPQPNFVEINAEGRPVAASPAVEQVSEYFTVKSRESHFEIVLTLEDILTTELCLKLQAELLAYANPTHGKHVVLSLTNVSRFSSEAINVILRLRKALDAVDKQVVLCEVGDEIREALQSLNLANTVLMIFRDLGEAAAALP